MVVQWGYCGSRRPENKRQGRRARPDDPNGWPMAGKCPTFRRLVDEHDVSINSYINTGPLIARGSAHDLPTNGAPPLAHPVPTAPPGEGRCGFAVGGGGGRATKPRPPATPRARPLLATGRDPGGCLPRGTSPPPPGTCAWCVDRVQSARLPLPPPRDSPVCSCVPVPVAAAPAGWAGADREWARIGVRAPHLPARVWRGLVSHCRQAAPSRGCTHPPALPVSGCATSPTRTPAALPSADIGGCQAGGGGVLLFFPERPPADAAARRRGGRGGRGRTGAGGRSWQRGEGGWRTPHRRWGRPTRPFRPPLAPARGGGVW